MIADFLKKLVKVFWLLPGLLLWASLETLIPFLLVWGLYALGEGAVSYSAPFADGSNELHVAMAQRNFPCVFKPAEREDPIAVYSNLLANVAYTRPDIVVLAESALSEFRALYTANGEFCNHHEVSKFVRPVPRTFDAPAGASVRFDLSWNPPE